MAGYDIFSQPQGPVIPVSLFGDATTAGINAGHSSPTGLTSAIRGVTKGAQTGEELVQGYQQIQTTDQEQQIRQHQIDRQPQADQEQDLQIQNQQNINDINKNKVAISDISQANNLDIAKQDSANQLQVAQQQRDDIQTSKSIATDLTDPSKQAQIMTNPSYQQYLIQHPKEGQQTVGALLRQGAITQQQADTYNESFDASAREKYLRAQIELQDQQRASLAKHMDAAHDTVYKDSNLSDITSQITPQNAGSIRVEPHTQPATNPDGSLVLNADGTAKIKGGPGTGQFDVFIGDKKLNKTPLNNETAAKQLQYYGLTAKAYDDVLKSNIGLRNNVSSSPAGPSSISSLSDAPDKTTTDIQNAGQPSSGTMEDRLLQKKEAVRKQLQNMKASPTTQGQTQTKDAATAVGKDNASFKQGYVPPEANVISPELSATADKNLTPVQKQIKKVPQLADYKPIVAAVSAVENAKGEPTLASHDKDGNPVAIGIMQVRPSTFNYVVQKYGKQIGLDSNSSILNTDSNILAGSTYLAEQMNTFGNEPGAGLELALAAYNSGPGNVAEALQRARANGDPTWAGVKKELKQFLNERAYKEVSAYPDLVLKKLYNYS